MTATEPPLGKQIRQTGNNLKSKTSPRFKQHNANKALYRNTNWNSKWNYTKNLTLKLTQHTLI